MKKMKQLFISITCLTIFLSGISVSAVNLGVDKYLKPAQKAAGYADATETTFAETIGKIVQVLLSFVGIIFLILMVYAGYLWMTARGESEQVETAKKIITASLIGIVITLGAFSITAFVVPKILESTGASVQ